MKSRQSPSGTPAVTMSALGQERTLFTVSLYDRVAPESGHSEPDFNVPGLFG